MPSAAARLVIGRSSTSRSTAPQCFAGVLARLVGRAPDALATLVGGTASEPGNGIADLGELRFQRGELFAKFL